jgi:ABC-type phosphate/phosphonate transport system substrate-binding protein
MVPGYGSPIEALAREAIERAGLRWNHDVITQTMRNDGACIREMLRGLADACAAFQAPSKVIQQRNNIKLRSIGQSRSLPAPLFAGHKRISGEDRKKIRKLLISLDNTTSGRFRLRKAGLNSIIDIDPADYAPLGPSSDDSP